MNPLLRLAQAAILASALVPQSPAHPQTDEISEGRWRMGSTTLGELTFFAGGATCAAASPTCTTDAVDVYDADSEAWSTAALSEKRNFIGATSVGGRAFFAGGWRTQLGSPSAVIDIYDPQLGPPSDPAAWSVELLSEPKGFIAAAALGDYAFFAGGAGTSFSNRVEIFDASSATWSVATLSVARSAISAVAVGDKVVFAGGINGAPSDAVDIYDQTVGPPSDPAAWSTATLPTPTALPAGVASSGKAYFAGGAVPNGAVSAVVNIYDAATDTWSTDSLSQPRRFVAGAAAGDYVYFAGGDAAANGALFPVVAPSDVIDVFDTVSGTWSVESLSKARVVGAAEAIGDRVAFAGGADTSAPVTTLDLVDVRIGDRYCSPAVPNSSGAAGRIEIAGSRLIARDLFELRASSLPTGSFGFFIASQTQGMVPQPGGSQGVLCLDGAIGRFVGPGQILNAGAAGGVSLPVALGALPTPTGLVPAAIGEAWSFQLWYRDANPGSTSNFTDAVSVTFF